MAYREVTMIEIKEFLRLWVSGTPKKRIAAEIGLDPKTVRRYAKAAESCGVQVEHGLGGLTEELVGAVIVALYWLSGNGTCGWVDERRSCG